MNSFSTCTSEVLFSNYWSYSIVNWIEESHDLMRTIYILQQITFLGQEEEF